MKPALAENRVTVDKKLFLEGSAALKSKTYKKIMVFLGVALLVLVVGTCVWITSQGGNPIFAIIEFLFMGILALWLLIWMPRSRNATKFKLMAQNTADGVLTRHTYFFNTYLQTTTETGNSITVSYRDIASLAESKHLWLLVCNNHQAVILGKESFVQGTIEDVKRIVGLNEKGVKTQPDKKQ